MGARRNKGRKMGVGHFQKAPLCHHKVSRLHAESYGKPLPDSQHRLT